MNPEARITSVKALAEITSEEELVAVLEQVLDHELAEQVAKAGWGVVASKPMSEFHGTVDRIRKLTAAVRA